MTTSSADANRKPVPRGVITLAKLLARVAAAEEHARRTASQTEAKTESR